MLPAHNPVLLYLMRIRDESHRFGVTFHRKLRNKETLASELTRIPGIGSEKKKKLLRHMGSLKRIMSASQTDLMEVEGIGEALATEIVNYFQQKGAELENGPQPAE